MTELILVSLSFVVIALYLAFELIFFCSKTPSSISDTYYHPHGKRTLTPVLIASTALAVHPMMELTPEPWTFLAFLITAGTFFVATTPAFKEDFQKPIHAWSASIAGVATFAWVIIMLGVPYLAILGFILACIKRKSFVFWIEIGLLSNLYAVLFYILLWR